jgi:hypothetical protein
MHQISEMNFYLRQSPLIMHPIQRGQETDVSSNFQLISHRHSTLPPLPTSFTEFSRTSPAKILCHLVQCLGDPHQQPAEEEQAYEGSAHHNREYDPIFLDRVFALDIGDLRREVASHEIDG